jgi:hypothetical protein
MVAGGNRRLLCSKAAGGTTTQQFSDMTKTTVGFLSTSSSFSCHRIGLSGGELLRTRAPRVRQTLQLAGENSIGVSLYL